MIQQAGVRPTTFSPSDVSSPGIFRPSGEFVAIRPEAAEISSVAQATIDTIDESLGQNAAAKPESQAEGMAVAECLGHAATCVHVRLMSEAMPEQWEEAKERNARVLGRAALVLENRVERPEEEIKRSLSRQFKAAHEGDATAREVLRGNAVSEVKEMALKTGTRMIAEARIVSGEITEANGATTEERQLNTRTTFSYKFQALDDMSKAEGQNAFGIEQGIKAGMLKPGDIVVECSPVPGAAHADLKGAGLFLREVMGIIRVTRLGRDGKVIIESYLVGGTEQSKLPPLEELKTKAQEEAAEKMALQNRFDIKAFRLFLKNLGVRNTDGMTPNDIIASPLFIAGEDGREAMDGIDLSMIYDKSAEEVTGQPMMMGSAELYKKVAGGQRRALTRSDYEEHFARIDELQKDLEPLGKKVARAAAKRWKEVEGDDYEAGRLMHKLSEQAVVRYLAQRLAVEASHPEVYSGIAMPDLSVMGTRTYHDLMEFQAHVLHNDLAKAEKALIRAEKNAQSSGCATAAKNESQKNLNDSGDFGNESSNDDEDDDDGLGSRLFRCKEGHLNVRPKGELATRCHVITCKKGSVGCEEPAQTETSGGKAKAIGKQGMKLDITTLKPASAVKKANRAQVALAA